MKKLLIFATMMALVSCENKQAEVKKERKISDLDSTIIKTFVTDYPEYKSNDLILEKASKSLNKTLDSLAKEKHLEQIPLSVFSIGKNPHGKGAIVMFYTNKHDVSDHNNFFVANLGFDIIGLMDENLAMTVNKDNKYYISGKKYKRLNEKETYFLVSRSFHSPEFNISPRNYGGAEVKLGVFSCEIDSIRSAE